MLLGLLAVVATGCTSGQAQCEAAGGQCKLGVCANVGPQDCNTNENPGGLGGNCCLPCPAGSAPDDAGTACVGAE
jgi:hypothetical protein